MLKCCVFIAFGFALFVSVDCVCSDYTVGVNSGVVCIGQTEFVFDIDIDRSGAAPVVVAPPSFKMQCPAGTVCADVAGACADSATEDPICPNGPGICGSCVGAKMACVTQTEFTFCSADEIVGSRQKCPTGKYCQVLDISAAPPVVPCAGTKSSSTCKAPVTATATTPVTATEATEATKATEPTEATKATEPTTPAAAFSCAGRLGTFAATTDTTCRQYYYCYSENNVIQAISYWCSATTVYNPTTKKCVATSLYKCTNV